MDTTATSKRAEDKKPYTGLQLVEYGELRQLTLGVGSMFSDANSGMTMSSQAPPDAPGSNRMNMN